jgi:hypothetical protein
MTNTLAYLIWNLESIKNRKNFIAKQAHCAQGYKILGYVPYPQTLG